MPNVLDIQDDWLFYLCGIVLIPLFTLVRYIFICKSKGAAVDHFYWILVSRAYRTQKRLPIDLKNKFLLEDSRQFYPPGFSFLLSLFSDKFISSPRSIWIIQFLDLLTIFVLIYIYFHFSLNPLFLVLVIVVFLSAPVLVAYNTQLTSRSLGNLLLSISLACQIVGASFVSNLSGFLYFTVGVFSFSAMILSHKMTTQFYFFLFPFWILSLCDYSSLGLWIGVLTPCFGLILGTMLTGIRFQKMQWIAHWDIIAFWFRNWPILGVHQFRNSPIYKSSASLNEAFHLQGLYGLIRHLFLVVSYLPAGLILPFTLFYTDPPSWLILAWFSIAYAAAILTLFIPFLKCLGGGHLYIYNAVLPTSLWWGHILSTDPSFLNFSLFAGGISVTLMVLFLGLLKRKRYEKNYDISADQLILHLEKIPPTNVAAFPVTFTEKIALMTNHSVFWGGHGFGFRILEPYWPVMKEPIRKTLADWNISYAILNIDWWPEGQTIFSEETGDSSPKLFGNWALYEVK